jgi:small-conductance mechanosensitive channel
MIQNITEFIEIGWISRWLKFGIALLIILLLAYITKRTASKHISDNNNKYRTKKSISLIGYVLIAISAFIIFKENNGNLGLSIGIASAGIAFALQEVITSFAGWISIVTSGQVKVGQRVKIGDIKGDIIDISILKTTLMETGDWVDGDLYNGRITTLSNSYIFKVPIQNYSADYPFVWDEIIIKIRSESDFQAARVLFEKIANDICGKYANESEAKWKAMQNKYRIENARVLPLITMKFDENWITFNIRYIVDYTMRRGTKDALFTRILEEINKTDKISVATSALEISNLNQK